MWWAARSLLVLSVILNASHLANSADNKRRQTRHAAQEDTRERLRSFLDQKLGKDEIIEPVVVNGNNKGGVKSSSAAAYVPKPTADEIEVKSAPASSQNTLSEMRSIVSDASPKQEKSDDKDRAPEYNSDICSHCPSMSGVAFTSLSLTKFWENDIASANGCSCMALQLRKDDPIALAVYAATSRQSGGANNNFDTGGFSSKTAPSVLRDWEVLAPFPAGQSHVDAGNFYLRDMYWGYCIWIVMFCFYRSVAIAS